MPIRDVIKESITQTGADAYTSAVVNLLDSEVGKTKKSKGGSKTKVMVLDELVLEWSALPNAVGDQVFFQLTSNEESAMVNVNDKDLIVKTGLDQEGAAAGASLFTNPLRIPLAGIPYFKKEIYVAIDSTSVGTVTCYFEIHYHYEYINAQQIARITNRRL